MIDQKIYNRYVFILVGLVCLYLFNPHARHKEDELAESNMISDEAARTPQSILSGIAQSSVKVSSAEALQVAVNDAMSLDPQNRPPIMSAPTLRMHTYKNGRQTLCWEVVLESAVYYVSDQDSSDYERVEVGN